MADPNKKNTFRGEAAIVVQNAVPPFVREKNIQEEVIIPVLSVIHASDKAGQEQGGNPIKQSHTTGKHYRQTPPRLP